MADDFNDAAELLHRAEQGNAEALGRLMACYRDRLRLMISLRMDRRLQGRLDPSDIIQEACLEATQRFADYLRTPDMPFYLWLRFLTAQRLLILHRRHLGTRGRDAGREVSINQGAIPEASSAVLAAQLVGQDTSPSEAVLRAEKVVRLQEALDQLEALDREVLMLRHFEQLSNRETAQVLGLRESAASQRYGRALLRLKDLLAEVGSEHGEEDS
jgi:RNA polymerase sigma-70 factor (ECF subfamily)